MFDSWFDATGGLASVEVSLDDGPWLAVIDIERSDSWRPVTIDLGPYKGRRIQVRFTLEGEGDGGTGAWRIRDVRLEARD